jgi:hypothetical protein
MTLDHDEARWALISEALRTDQLPSDTARLIAIGSIVASREPLTQREREHAQALASRFGWEKERGVGSRHLMASPSPESCD